MRKLSVRLKTVTPMFLGGANPRGQEPELRPASFRGGMRYWFRVVLGGVIGDDNPTALRELEEKVFGSTQTGSPISITLNGTPEHDLHYILPHHNSGPRPAFMPDQTFILTLRMNRPVLQPEDKVIWVNACMALNMLILFGGVGLRSRRGFGSLSVVTATESKITPVTPSGREKWNKYIKWIPKNAHKYAQYLAKVSKISTASLPDPPTKFPCASKHTIVRVPRDFAKHSPEDALSDMMKRMPKKAYLGGIQPNRQASPLWIRVCKIDGQYRLLMCAFTSGVKSDTDSYPELKSFLDSSFPADGKDILIKGWNYD